MGTNTNQIATEGNVENNTTYAGNIISSKTNTKCITVKRLLQGLIETSKTPTYNTSTDANRCYSTYQVKTYSTTATTAVSLSAGYMSIANNTSKIIASSSGNYGSYPFGTGTAFLALNTNNHSTTIQANITVTCVQLVNPTGDDGVSPASLDFDNPEYDNESNAPDEYPTTVNTQGSNTRCIQAGGGGLDGSCFANEVELPCYNKATACSPYTCSQETTCPFEAACLSENLENGNIYDVTTTVRFQIYAGTVDGEEKYVTLCSEIVSLDLTVNSNKYTSITLNIPTRQGFNISGTPSGVAKFRLEIEYTVVGLDYDVGIRVGMTATVPKIAFVIYNPGPKCIKYTDLSTVYTLY